MLSFEDYLWNFTPSLFHRSCTYFRHTMLATMALTVTKVTVTMATPVKAAMVLDCMIIF